MPRPWLGGASKTERRRKVRRRQVLCLLLSSMFIISLGGCGKEEPPPKATEVTEETEAPTEKTSVFQEFEFYSDDESLILYNFPEEYSLEGKTYRLSPDIDYETLGTRDVVQVTVDMAVEDMGEIPDSYEYETESGKTYELANEQVYVKTKGLVQIPVTEEIHYDKQYGRPSPASTKLITYYDEKEGVDKEVEGTLTHFEETTAGRWESVLSVDGTFMAPADSVDTYELAGAENVVVSRTAQTPEWEGYQSDVLSSLGLSQQYFRVTGAAWNGEQYEQDGYIYRNAVFTGDAFVSDFVATYEGMREAEGYDTTVFYRLDADHVDAGEEEITTVYHIKAVVRYALVEE